MVAGACSDPSLPLFAPAEGKQSIVAGKTNPKRERGRMLPTTMMLRLMFVKRSPSFTLRVNVCADSQASDKGGRRGNLGTGEL